MTSKLYKVHNLETGEIFESTDAKVLNKLVNSGLNTRTHMCTFYKRCENNETIEYLKFEVVEIKEVDPIEESEKTTHVEKEVISRNRGYIPTEGGFHFEFLESNRKLTTEEQQELKYFMLSRLVNRHCEMFIEAEDNNDLKTQFKISMYLEQLEEKFSFFSSVRYEYKYDFILEIIHGVRIEKTEEYVQFKESLKATITEPTEEPSEVELNVGMKIKSNKTGKTYIIAMISNNDRVYLKYIEDEESLESHVLSKVIEFIKSGYYELVDTVETTPAKEIADFETIQEQKRIELEKGLLNKSIVIKNNSQNVPNYLKGRKGEVIEVVSSNMVKIKCYHNKEVYKLWIDDIVLNKYYRLHLEPFKDINTIKTGDKVRIDLYNDFRLEDIPELKKFKLKEFTKGHIDGIEGERQVLYMEVIGL